MKKQITILNLYSRDMNVYGDIGNVIALKKRLQWRGYEPIVIEYNTGDELPESVDIIVGGGGQDSNQSGIIDDLQSIKPTLQKWADEKVPMLMVCGMYQLFGKIFKTKDGTVLEGIGLLDVETYGGNERLVGNIVTSSDKFGQIVGYENHSGKTYIGDEAKALGEMIQGAGNNGQDNTEGAISSNVIGTYLHGALLPKNPLVADFLINAALKNIGIKNDDNKSLDIDKIAEKARQVAIKRPR